MFLLLSFFQGTGVLARRVLVRFWRPVAPAAAGFNLGIVAAGVTGHIPWWSWFIGALLTAFVGAGYIANR
jgi:hypothetical protein